MSVTKGIFIWITGFAMSITPVFGVDEVPQIDIQKAWRGKDQQDTNVKAENCMPKIVGNTILCGNKYVQCLPDGKISVCNAGGKLADIFCYYAVINKKNEKIDWGNFDPRASKLEVRDGKFIWELYRTTFGETWKAADQTLEITPGGLLRFHITLYLPPNADIEPRTKPGYLFINLPVSRADGQNILYNGQVQKLNIQSPAVGDYRSKDFFYTLYSDSPAERFSIESGKSFMDMTSLSGFPKEKLFRLTFVFLKDRTGEFTIDLRKSVPMLKDSTDTRGGVNFKAIENIHLPDESGKNLFQNASFERGLEGYRVGHPNMDGHWEWIPFALDEKEAFHGSHSLVMNARHFGEGDYRRLQTGVNLTTTVAIVDPGRYTISLYAKCENGKTAVIDTWVPNFHSGSYYTTFNGDSIGKFDISPQWQRYSVSFDVPQAMPLEVNLNAGTRSESCKVYIDALQLEKGTSATAFLSPPAEGRLITSNPNNFVSAKEKLNARIIVTTAKKNISGSVNIKVKNFFGETLLNQKFEFQSNDKNIAQIALPLDWLPGQGIFVIRADYTLADDSKFYEYHRYAKVSILGNDYPLAHMFALDYGDPEQRFDFIDQLKRWKQLGIGSKQHHHGYLRNAWDAECKYGIIPSHASMASYLRDEKRKLIGFCILNSSRTEYSVHPNDKRILVRDFHFDSNEKFNPDAKITSEWLTRFTHAVKTVAAKNSSVTMWCLGEEFIAKFPVSWWNKNDSEEEMARMHALLLKAFAKGVREGNPKAKVLQDAPCNMRADGGIAETDRLLTESDKIGLKFDAIAIHIYRARPESPDLDADAMLLFKMLAKHGYGTTPVLWPEGMHWAPIEIPQWGTLSSTWGGPPHTWPGALLTYDMGWTEKRSAAWYARTWLVALKYADRIVGATAGNVYNNCYMDVLLTPYASQLVPNTLGVILGDSHFRKDIRFASFLRAYVFEDARKRPVAAVWCCLDKVDDGYADSPVVEADFGNSLESVFDMMNSPRAFQKGKFRFPVSTFPLFLRGKPGTLDKMIMVLEKAVVVSGEGISPLFITANPQSKCDVKITFRNFLSSKFSGTMAGHEITVPPSGSTDIILPLPERLFPDKIVTEPINVEIKSNSGAKYGYDLSFEALMAKHVPENISLTTLDWPKLSPIRFSRNVNKRETTGDFRIGWNSSGLFLEVIVKDPKFLHVEYKKTADRWQNDCLQIFIDTMANARTRTVRGYDEDDYDYAVFPNAKGDSSIVWRSRSVEQQLGLATQAPPDKSIASDIPSSFSNKNGILTYRVFFPAKYLLPMKLKKGWVFGLGLYVPNSDTPGKVTSALTIASDGKDCWNRPFVWPAVLLTNGEAEEKPLR